MREAADAALPDTATVSRKTITSDGAGGQTEAWADASSYSCRAKPASRQATERVIALRPSAVSAWTIYLPAGADVKPVDRLRVGSTTYEVVAVSTRSWEIGRQADCVVIQ